jgi:hypothetical protein
MLTTRASLAALCALLGLSACAPSVAEDSKGEITDGGGDDSSTDDGTGDDGSADGTDGTGGTDGTDGGTDGTDGTDGGTDGTDGGTEPTGPVDYVGDFTLDLAIEGFGEDACIGTVNLVVDEAADTLIAGSAECAFSGPLAFAGGITATMTADLASSSSTTIEGELIIAVPLVGDYAVGWGGTYDGASITSEDAGTIDVSGFSIDYVLDLAAEPV